MKNQLHRINLRWISTILLAIGLLVMLLGSSSLDAAANQPVKPAGLPSGGNANLTFSQFITSPGAQYGAVDDLNGDGYVDAVTSSCEGSTLILHNDRQGNFVEVQRFDFLSYCFVGVVVGDLDGDLAPDVLLFDNSLLDNIVLWNNGDGTFTNGYSAFISNHDAFAALSDLDNDGDLDVFVTAGLMYSGTIRTWENNGAGQFTLLDDFDDSYHHTDLALGDLNNDGSVDAFTTSWGDGYNKVWLNDGTGHFIENQSIPGANTFTVALGDLNDDECLDAYLSNIDIAWNNLPDEVWLNDCSGNFSNSGQTLNTASTMGAALGDLDADGDLDVYIASSPTGNIEDEIWVNDGSGIFSFRRSLVDGFAGSGTTLSDIDNDGDLDAISLSFDPKGYYVLKNGDWHQAAQMPEPVGAYGYAQCPDQPNSLYIIGGLSNQNTAVDNVWRYDAITDTWNELAPLPAFQGLDAPPAVCYGEKIYVVAGPLQVYDIETNTWTIDGEIPRYAGGSAVGAWDGKIYRIGGVYGSYLNPPFNYVDVYDIASGTWEMNGGTPAPQAALLPGYTQIGQYLYLAGGTGALSPSQNVDILQRYDMASDTWEHVPFLSARGLGLSLVYSGHTLYAIGGDVNGGGYFDPTDLVESYDLSTWPEGTWEVYADTYPYPVLGNTTGFCGEIKTGGEIWSVSGANGTLDNPVGLHANSYHSTGETCVKYAINLPEPLQGHGFAGETVDYTISITNTGNVTDYFNLDVSTAWGGNHVSSEIGPIDPGETIELVISIDIPDEAEPGEQGISTVTLISMRDPSIASTTQLTTKVFYAIFVPLTMKN